MILADGKEGFRQFMAAFKQKYPQSHSSIVREFADGDYVILHVQAQRLADGAGRAYPDGAGNQGSGRLNSGT